MQGVLANWVRQDREAAHKLVTSHLRLAAKIAMGYRGYGLPQAEVISEANVGLMQIPRQPARSGTGLQQLPFAPSRRRAVDAIV